MVVNCARPVSAPSPSALLQVRIYIAARDALNEHDRSAQLKAFCTGIHDKYGEGNIIGGEIDPTASQRRAATEVQQATQRLQMTVDLQGYRQAFPTFLLALEAQHLLPRAAILELQTNERLQDALHQNYTLREVPQAVAVVRAAVCGMTPTHLQFINELHASGGLLEFLASFETLGQAAFLNQASLVTSQSECSAGSDQGACLA